MLLTCYFSLLSCFTFIISYLHVIDPKINSLIENQAIVFHSSNPGGTTEGSCDRPRCSASNSVSPFPGGFFRAPARPPFEAIARYLLIFIRLTTRSVASRCCGTLTCFSGSILWNPPTPVAFPPFFPPLWPISESSSRGRFEKFPGLG